MTNISTKTVTTVRIPPNPEFPNPACINCASGAANCKLSNVTFESGAFVATADFQSQITSVDGANWTRLSIDTARR